MAYANVSVGTSATQIVAKSVSSPPRIGLLIKNNSSVVVYLGEDSSVTTSNGYPLQPGDQFILDFDGSIAGHWEAVAWASPAPIPTRFSGPHPEVSPDS